MDVVWGMDGWMWFGEWMGGCDLEDGWMDVVWGMDGWMWFGEWMGGWMMGGFGLENRWVDG